PPADHRGAGELGQRGQHRLRHPQAPDPPGPRPVREREDQAPPDDRPRRDGGLSGLEDLGRPSAADPPNRAEPLPLVLLVLALLTLWPPSRRPSGPRPPSPSRSPGPRRRSRSP